LRFTGVYREEDEDEQYFGVCQLEAGRKEGIALTANKEVAVHVGIQFQPTFKIGRPGGSQEISETDTRRCPSGQISWNVHDKSQRQTPGGAPADRFIGTQKCPVHK